jgi:uncharacterized protein (DUF433 family)
MSEALPVQVFSRPYNQLAQRRAWSVSVQEPRRITRDPEVMGGKPCVRGLRVTVGTILGLLASGYNEDEILDAYPYLKLEDIREALRYAAWRLEELELPIAPA